MKTGEIAERLGVSDNTIRNWSRDYANYLSDQGAGLQPGATREFTQDDVIVLATIAEYRDSGLTHEQISDLLDEGKRTALIPPPPPMNEDRVRENVELTTRERAEVEILTARLNMLQAQFAQALQERENAVKAEREALKRIDELHQELADAKASAARMEERASRLDELNAEIRRLKETLEAERNRKRGPFGWW